MKSLLILLSFFLLLPPAPSDHIWYRGHEYSVVDQGNNLLWVSTEPNTMTRRGDWLFIHDVNIDIDDLEDAGWLYYERDGELHRYQLWKSTVYYPDGIPRIEQDVEDWGSLAIQTCYGAGRKVLFFEEKK